MKPLLNCLLMTFVFTSSGCITSKVVEKAKDQERWNPEIKKSEKVPGHPGYYALVPLTIPMDIPLLPFVFVYSLAFPGH